MSFESNASQSTSNQKYNRRGLGYFLAFCFALGAFFSGIQVGEGVFGYKQTANIFNLFASAPAEEEMVANPNLDEFWKVWNLLEEKFATGSTTREFSDEERLQGAIDGLVDSYQDPYTVYLPPKDAATFDENISGNFSGVGMEVGLRDGVITIISPLPDTPAESAGIIAGDVIIQIDEKSTKDMRIDEAVELIRGEKGTEVSLQIFREGETEFLTILVTRDTINIPTVKTETVGDTFFVAIYSFNAVAESQVKTALQEYLESGAETLVIDVRGNPGGFLQSAVNIASYFLPSGKVVVREEFGESSRNDTFRSRGRQIQVFNPKNLVVLIDNGSASASEILAGALKDHGIATVIGTKSFGKGSVQELVKLDNGASLKVTVARWLTPNGTSISDGGLNPDIFIKRTPAQRLASEDPQKDAAVLFLSGVEVLSEISDEVVDINENESTGE
ncbi:MAG: carboxyl-terminal processing protease [Candidatus Paceibacteria bacterium]|jgi:carboxyl-terminal processing protease